MVYRSEQGRLDGHRLEDMKMTDVSPDFDGYVMTAVGKEVEDLIDALDETCRPQKGLKRHQNRCRNGMLADVLTPVRQ